MLLLASPKFSSNLMGLFFVPDMLLGADHSEVKPAESLSWAPDV